MKASSPAILWLRHDLRLADHLALEAALEHGGPVVPVFLWTPEEEGNWPPGAASRWWLHQSLAALDRQLRARHSRLIFRKGPTLQSLRSLIQETGAEAIFWSRRYEPVIAVRDAQIRSALREEAITAEGFPGALLHEPWAIQNLSGKPYRVFTPFWNSALKQPPPGDPLPAPKRIPSPSHWPESLELAELELEPRVDWAGGMREAWQPGEYGARKQLSDFLIHGLASYDEGRDRADLAGTSRLSPHLHFGEISPRQVWHAVRAEAEKSSPGDKTWKESRFLTEIGWREFAHHLLHHFPETPTEPLREEFKKFPWSQNHAALRAWQTGRTGFPLVDAGLRQMWKTGWMHNRVRMIVASFLVKDLLLPWQEGTRWFWDTLVDADLANNTLGWQWVAGCGADAAPYFRVFNPVSQAGKSDPQGTYVRRWCPELAALPDEWIHHPWEAPPNVLQAAGVILGETYPAPIVDHAQARKSALAAFSGIK